MNRTGCLRYFEHLWKWEGPPGTAPILLTALFVSLARSPMLRQLYLISETFWTQLHNFFRSSPVSETPSQCLVTGGEKSDRRRRKGFMGGQQSDLPPPCFLPELLIARARSQLPSHHCGHSLPIKLSSSLSSSSILVSLKLRNRGVGPSGLLKIHTCFKCVVFV